MGLTGRRGRGLCSTVVGSSWLARFKYSTRSLVLHILHTLGFRNELCVPVLLLLGAPALCITSWRFGPRSAFHQLCTAWIIARVLHILHACQAWLREVLIQSLAHQPPQRFGDVRQFCNAQQLNGRILGFFPLRIAVLSRWNQNKLILVSLGVQHCAQYCTVNAPPRTGPGALHPSIPS